MNKIKRERESIDRQRSEQEIRPKKLKLIIRDRNVSTILEDFQKCSDSNAAVELLNEISSFYPFKSNDCENFVTKCFEKFGTLNFTVRLKIIEILRMIVERHWLKDGQLETLAEIILENLHIEGNDEDCETSLFTLLYEKFSQFFNDPLLFRRISEEIRKYFTSNSWRLRRLAINVYAKICIQQKQQALKERAEQRNVLLSPKIYEKLFSFGFETSNFDVENVLLKFCDDFDERVRIAAVENLIMLTENGWKLPYSLYSSLISLLSDVCFTVRVYGLRLVHAIAEFYPETLVPGPNKNADIRLIDDAFSKLCNSMHDISVDVRTQAAKLLGTMLNVSEKFLEQTLDKKLMSKLKYLKSGDQKTSNFFSEWATGRKFGEDTAVEKIDEDLAALIPSGACGAFVTGLEDEYLAVRNASIDAVCHLSKQSTSFANKAMDFLADMFNDEIEEVRLNAIKSLRQLCQCIVLKEDQMETILSALDDASSDSREALRELLSTCTLHSVSCLTLTIDALMNNLKRYAHDKVLIWNCMKYLGLNHPTLVQPLVQDLLSYHPYFDTPEPSIDDPFYISKLLLVLNAASKCQTIKSLFLPHTWRHYDYLRNSNPHLAPSLDISKNDNEKDQNDSFIDALSKNAEDSLNLATMLNGPAKCELLKLTLKSLERICKFSPKYLAKSSFLQLFCSTLLTFYVTISRRSNFISIKSEENLAVKTLKQVFMDTFRLQFLWGIENHALETVYALRIRILCELTKFDCKKYWPYLNHCLEQSKEYFKNSDEKLYQNLQNAAKNLDFDFNDCQNLVDLMEIRLKTPPQISDTLNEKTVLITEPDKESERVLRFVADLIAAVPLAATLRNFDQSDFPLLRIRTTYPDQKSRFQRLRLRDIKEIGPNCHRLRTEAFLADVVWSDVSVVELSLVLVLPESACGFLDDSSKNFITLTAPVPVRVYPKLKC